MFSHATVLCSISDVWTYLNSRRRDILFLRTQPFPLRMQLSAYWTLPSTTSGSPIVVYKTRVVFEGLVKLPDWRPSECVNWRGCASMPPVSTEHLPRA